MNDNSVSRFVRRSVFTGLVILAPLLLSSCFFPFPSRPNDKPLYITPDGQNLTFLWCGEDSEPKVTLELEYRKLQEGNDEFHTAAEGRGNYILKKGQEFSSLRAPQGLNFETAEPIPLDYVPIFIFVYAQPANPEASNDLAQFSVNEAMEADRWYNPAGEEFAEKPC